PSLRRAHRIFRVLLHGYRVQSDRDRRQFEEAWGVYSRYPPRGTDSGVHRLRAHAYYRGWRRLSRHRLPASGNADFVRGRAVLLRRHVTLDRCERHHGHRRADPGISAGAPIRRADQEIQAEGQEAMNSDLMRRVAVTLGALLVYRIGTFIPLPGLDHADWELIFRSQSGGMLGLANFWSGGALGRLAVCALNIVPYISAAILIQLLSLFSSRLRLLRERDDRGRRTFQQYTLCLTLFLSAFQA